MSIVRGTTITTPISRSAVADDSCVSSIPWSSKNTVDKLCPSFTESGTIVTCEPVEGYPLEVVSSVNQNLVEGLNWDVENFANPTIALDLRGGDYTLYVDAPITVETDGGTSYGTSSGSEGNPTAFTFTHNGGSLYLVNKEWINITNCKLETGTEYTGTNYASTITRCGKNLLPAKFGKTFDLDGATGVYNDDGTITIQGTPTSNKAMDFWNWIPATHLAGKQVVIPNVGSSNTYWFYLHTELANGTRAWNVLLSNNASNLTTTMPNDLSRIAFGVAVATGFSGSATTLYPQLELGTTATAFEPPKTAETFAIGENVPALPGVNTLWADKGIITVTGKANPSAIIENLPGGGTGGSADAVLYTKQNLAEAQKSQARANIGAVSADYVEQAIADATSGVDLSEYELKGSTPQYLAGVDTRYNIVLDIKEETAVSIVSDTVADLSTAENIGFDGATETYENGIYTITSKGGGLWFRHRKRFEIGGLTPGEEYRIMYDTTGVKQTNTDKDFYATLSAHDVTDPNLPNVFTEQISIYGDVKKFDFTAPSTRIIVYLNAVSSDMTTFEGVQIQYRDIWVNKKSASVLRTEIYKKNVTTSKQLVLNDINGGLTIDAVPGTDVYVQTIEEQQTPSILSGKTCVCFGDSITGNYAKLFDYPSVIAAKTGMTVVNGGFGGCRMAKHPSDMYDAYSMYRLADSVASGDWSVQDAVADAVAEAGSPMYAADHINELKALDWNKVDIVTILFGANDFTGGVGLESDSDPLSTTHYKGAARYSIEKLLTAYPKLRIVLLSPLYHYKTVDGETVDTDTYTSGGNKMSDFIEALEEVAKEYKLPFLDMYNTLGINKLNRKDMLPDGAHPSSAGIERIGESISARLMSI